MRIKSQSNFLSLRCFTKTIIMKHISIISRNAGLLLVVLLLSATAVAQNADFSGKWKLDPAKSKLNEEFSMAPKELVVTQDAATLTVERHSEFQDQVFVTKDIITLDGKECLNEGWQGSKKKSTATWSADKKALTIKSTIAMENAGEITITEVYTLVEGGLSILTTNASDWGTSTETYVFGK